jgi:hypothetical protein
MSTVVRINPGAQTQHINSNTSSTNSSNVISYGRVFHIVKNDKDYGYSDWTSIGKIYYVLVNQPTPKKDEINNILLSTYENQSAFPLSSHLSYFPQQEEIVVIYNIRTKNYYSNVVNLYNSNHHNSDATNNIENDNTLTLGSYVEEKSILNLYPFEGDLLINGRWGHGIRFGSTLHYSELNNTWSSYGDVGDPIIKLVNGYQYIKDNEGKPHIENINKDNSSIYMTSHQSINLIPSRFISSNPVTNPIVPSSYTNPQIILSSDRITLNSKKDEIILCSNTNIELSSKNNIHLDSDGSIFLNSPKVFLGINENTTPTEPVLLGKQTYQLLSDLISSLNEFSSDLKLYKTQGEGVSNPILNSSADTLRGKLKGMRKRLINIYSKTVFVAN